MPFLSTQALMTRALIRAFKIPGSSIQAFKILGIKTRGFKIQEFKTQGCQMRGHSMRVGGTRCFGFASR